jgi:hypothetical protein
MRCPVLMSALFALSAGSTLEAQGLTMQMSNGWNFAFAGNVNIFAQFQSQSASGNTIDPQGAGMVGPGKAEGFYYSSGYVPAIATFTASGKEGGTDLVAHFNFGPKVQCGNGNHDCFGSLIDMRQVFLSIGGSWGTLTAGRDLGVFLRQNILSDQTLFGVGGGGIAPAGTPLGRIGFGYLYPNFVAQMTYTTPVGRPGSLAVGLMDPSDFGPYVVHDLPRLEAEGTYKAGNLVVFANGTAQHSKTAPSGGTGKTAYGVSAGLTYRTTTFSLHGSGYWGRGIGSAFMFGPLAADGTGNLTKAFGYYGQVTLTPAGGKATIAGSFGSSFLKPSTGNQKTENSLISGGIYYRATKSLLAIAEDDYMWTKITPSGGATSNKAFTAALGFMLFY